MLFKKELELLIHPFIMCVPLCVSVCGGGLLTEARRGQQIPWTGVTITYEPPDMHEGNQTPALEQQTLLTTEQSLQAVGKT